MTGFTAFDLHQVEALAPLQNQKAENLGWLDAVPIHPFYAKELWDTPFPLHLAMYPLGKGIYGYWEVGKAMMPRS